MVMINNVLANGRASSTSNEGRLFGRNVFQRIVRPHRTELLVFHHFAPSKIRVR
jgi:hypothetical protein